LDMSDKKRFKKKVEKTKSEGDKKQWVT
jgi:hypothetical protein